MDSDQEVKIFKFLYSHQKQIDRSFNWMEYFLERGFSLSFIEMAYEKIKLEHVISIESFFHWTVKQNNLHDIVVIQSGLKLIDLFLQQDLQYPKDVIRLLLFEKFCLIFPIVNDPYVYVLLLRIFNNDKQDMVQFINSMGIITTNGTDVFHANFQKRKTQLKVDVASFLNTNVSTIITSYMKYNWNKDNCTEQDKKLAEILVDC